MSGYCWEEQYIFELVALELYYIWILERASPGQLLTNDQPGFSKEVPELQWLWVKRHPQRAAQAEFPMISSNPIVHPCFILPSAKRVRPLGTATSETRWRKPCDGPNTRGGAQGPCSDRPRVSGGRESCRKVGIFKAVAGDQDLRDDLHG